MATPDNPSESSAPALGRSHKRTSSSAENTQQQPQVKRQAPDISEKVEPQPQYVYVVQIEQFDREGESIPDIRGVYATVRDANNAVKAIVNDEFGPSSELDRDVDEEGLVSWCADDGNGENRAVSTEKMKVEAPRSVPECEWETLEDGDGDEDEDVDRD
ncbi:uncharacterized protein PAC_09534 [Phialocephala subalpina]|uniref:Uncharacterized protein n=1 Tax=Phialocephala subalpina TaxID=576137 RepID=A0A1L7X3N4_9HELO|nr:uncharacterized protein PAC_09534 [Phialocephala subalpina]